MTSPRQMAINVSQRIGEQVESIATDMAKSAARRGVHEGKRAVSTPYPPASLPGNPPHRRTGRFRRGINATVTAVSRTLHGAIQIRGRVSSRAPYGKFLEFGTRRMRARPWAKIVLKGIGAAMRKGRRR